MAIEGYTICTMLLDSTSRVASDEQEYNACQAAVAGLLQVCDVEEKYEALIENYLEWEAAINQLALRAMVTWTTKHVQFQEARKLLARKLSNMLASTRLYLDSLPRHSEAVLADDAAALDRVKNAPSEQYDGHLAYRVLEALRNHAQHSSLPVHGTTTHSQWNWETEPQSLSFTILPRIVLDDLAADSKFKKSVLTELASLEKIELKAMVRQYIECLSTIHSAFRMGTTAKTNTWLALLQRSAEKFTHEFANETTIALAVLPIDGGGLKAGEPVYIAGPIQEYLKHLQSKYSSMVNFAKRRVDF